MSTAGQGRARPRIRRAAHAPVRVWWRAACRSVPARVPRLIRKSSMHRLSRARRSTMPRPAPGRVRVRVASRCRARPLPPAAGHRRRVCAHRSPVAGSGAW
ncbi:MAG: hypothetical protein CMP07_03335 [Xanthomonadales bacterium]|nr:hypothetical protein [Xanthomonadales bacterium]